MCMAEKTRRQPPCVFFQILSPIDRTAHGESVYGSSYSAYLLRDRYARLTARHCVSKKGQSPTARLVLPVLRDVCKAGSNRGLGVSHPPNP